ncbi:MAG: fatty acid desaturase [Bacteroidetes bacterium]|nr:MAG: fatty acid desaturase [Bacteroidota bacterium]
MDRTDFIVSTKNQPHPDRCREILKKHPEIARLIGRNPWTFALLVGLVGLQLGIAAWLGSLGFASHWWLALILAYFVGAFANHSLYVIIHEGTHHLIFKNRFLNRLSVVLADLVNVVPGGTGFATYHIKHHSHLGDDDMDADLAMEWEARLVKNIWWRKALWLFLFPVFQIIRTGRIHKVNTWHTWMFINIAAVFAFDVAVVYFLGWNALFYLFFSMMFALGLHPLGARWIQEHYTLDPNQETYSYYGPLNLVALNMGYHNEHHDFPAIPWNRLPEVKRLAPEYYDTLKYHSSWTKLLFEFIFNPEYSLYSRVKRAKPQSESNTSTTPELLQMT